MPISEELLERFDQIFARFDTASTGYIEQEQWHVVPDLLYVEPVVGGVPLLQCSSDVRFLDVHASSYQ